MKPRLTETDFQNAAIKLGCEVEAIKAVALVEAAGYGFDEYDRPKVLFERHLFHKYTHGQFDHSHPNISNAVPGGYGAGGAHQYDRFSEAFELDPNAAMMAASWGKFQILGANFAICGYATVGAFVDAMKEGEGQHLDAFCEFVVHNHLDDELTAHNWAGFAKGYNGANYRINNYDGKLASAYAHYKHQSSPVRLSDSPSAANPSPFDQPVADASIPSTLQVAQPETPPTIPDPPPSDAPAKVEQTTLQTPEGTTQKTVVSSSGGPVDVQAVKPGFKTWLMGIVTMAVGFYKMLKEDLGEMVDQVAQGLNPIIVIKVAIGAFIVAAGYWFLYVRHKQDAATTAKLIDAAADQNRNTVNLVK